MLNDKAVSKAVNHDLNFVTKLDHMEAQSGYYRVYYSKKEAEQLLGVDSRKLDDLLQEHNMPLNDVGGEPAIWKPYLNKLRKVLGIKA